VLSGACLASQDSRATHRGTLLSELSAHGHAATFEPRTLAANLGGMCDDTGGGGVSLLRAGLCGGNVRHGLACGSVPHRTPTEPPDGSKDGGCSSTHQKTGATTPRLAVTRRARAGLPRARAAPKMRSAPALSLSATRWRRRPARSKGACANYTRPGLGPRRLGHSSACGGGGEMTNSA
jgi:hypothetical protein